MIGLVGPSGAGKSTVINLLARFYDVSSGAIEIDGVNIRDVTMHSLRRQIGMVLQEPHLFHGTVAENIAYGNPDATPESIMRAARTANAHDFVIAFPDGYDTLVGERGTRLSGGERQRIGIARAILKDPRILILDEATSSVDTETEMAIREAMQRLVAGRTTIAIAHRFSTLRNADRLLVVMAATQPKPRRDLIDRLLVVGESGRVTPVIVLNKMDLDGAAEVAGELEAVYLPLGYDVLRVSAVSGEGMDRLSEQLCKGIAALAGPSGVGKSSLVNTLEPEHALRTGELSKKHGTGRHTTVSSSLIQLRCGGLVADTPGFSDVGVWGVPREELDRCFPELRSLTPSCRFRECSHLHEPDCAVRQGLDDGAIDPGRFESYRILYEESAA